MCPSFGLGTRREFFGEDEVRKDRVLIIVIGWSVTEFGPLEELIRGKREVVQVNICEGFVEDLDG